MPKSQLAPYNSEEREFQAANGSKMCQKLSEELSTLLTLNCIWSMKVEGQQRQFSDVAELSGEGSMSAHRYSAQQAVPGLCELQRHLLLRARIPGWGFPSPSWANHLSARVSSSGQFRKACPGQHSHAPRHICLQEPLQMAAHVLEGAAPAQTLNKGLGCLVLSCPWKGQITSR